MEIDRDRMTVSHAELKENGSYRKNVPLVNLSCKGVTEHRGET